MNTVSLGNHILFLDNIVEIKWYEETGEVVLLSTDSEYMGIKVTKMDFERFSKDVLKVEGMVNIQGHIINSAHVVDIRYDEDEGNIVVLTTDSEYMGIEASKVDFNKVVKALVK